MNRQTVLMAACLPLVSVIATADGPLMPDFELQSQPLTPALILNESQRPIHQVRLLIEGRDQAGHRGLLILDPNTPEFDEFGQLIGGVQTPQSRGKAGALRTMELPCVVEFLKTGPDKWRLFRLRGPKVTSSLFVATRGQLGDGGPARLVVLDNDKKVKSVVGMTWYGLTLP